MCYRTIRSAAAYYREHDPGTAITENFIRQLVISGAVPSMRAGKKYLVSLEKLDEYLQNPRAAETTTAPLTGKTWKIH